MGTAIILIKLIAAHLVGDFILQTDKLCADKFSNNKAFRYRALSVHALVHAALAYLFVAQWNNWAVPLVIGASHFLIDLVKTHFKRKDLVGFVCDQLAHYCVIVVLWLIVFANHDYSQAAKILSANFFAYSHNLYCRTLPHISFDKIIHASLKGLPNAGKWIGYLERILILTFILPAILRESVFYWLPNPCFVSAS